MTLLEFLKEREAAIALKWRDRVLDCFFAETDPSARAGGVDYAGDRIGFFKKQGDPFANPIGNSVTEGTAAIVEGFLAGRDPQTMAGHLERMLKIGALQKSRASEVLPFVYQLKELIHEVIATDHPGASAPDPVFTKDLSALENRLDGLALLACDVFVSCRERLYEIRINEIKRSVATLMRRANDTRPRSGKAKSGRETAEQQEPS